MGIKKFSLAVLVAVACTSAAPAGFIIEDDAVAGNSWSQRIVFYDAGGIDFIYFEIIDDTHKSGPFNFPGVITNFGDPTAGDDPIADWGTTFESTAAVTGAGPATTLLAVVLDFAGSITAPIEFRGVAFRGGELLFSATFNWDGLGSSGFGQMYLTAIDVWDPDQTSLPAGNMMPLPAPVWLGTVGLFAVIAMRRKLV